MIYTKLTNEAMRIAYRAHHGQVDKSGIPYIFHPCHLAEQMPDEYTTCVALLHDVVEDVEGVTLEDLPVNEEARELVRLMTKDKSRGSHDPEMLEKYYGGIASNPKAALIKCIDRCNNITTMSWGLGRDKIYRMITETEQYYPELLKVLKDTPEYNNASWLLKYHIESMLDIYKRLL